MQEALILLILCIDVDYEKTFHSRHQFGIPDCISRRHAQADGAILARLEGFSILFPQVSGDSMIADISAVDRVEVNGVRLAYTQCGQGADVVFLHGWMCNRTFWQRQCRELAGRNFRCTAVDFRGHGDSEAPAAGYSIEQLAGDLSAVMAALGIGPAVIVGHSMGGMVAQRFCLERPEQTAALALVATIASDGEDRLISKRIAADATGMGFARAFDRHFDAWFAPGAPKSVRGWVKRRMRSTPDEVGLQLVGAYSRFDLTRRLGEIRRPALVIGTRSDDSAPPAQSRLLAELIPGGRLALIEDCGHFPMLEKPELLSRVLLPFLEAQDAPGEN